MNLNGFLLLLIPMVSYGEVVLRSDNISDAEVRQIQAVVRSLGYDKIRYIGPVTSGCECTEGDSCDAQVVVATEDDIYDFSKINAKWQVGNYEKWKRDFDALNKKYRMAATESEHDSAYALIRSHAKSHPKILFCKKSG